MATCPNCGVSTRQEPGAMKVETVFVAQPLGTFSLAGGQLKASARARSQLSCTRCGWSTLGRIEGEDFIADRPPGTGS